MTLTQIGTRLGAAPIIVSLIVTVILAGVVVISALWAYSPVIAILWTPFVVALVIALAAVLAALRRPPWHDIPAHARSH